MVVIDNYDSFTWNLVQYLGEFGIDVRVFRNDEIHVNELMAMNPEAILLSPGPSTPDNAGITLDVIRAAAGQVPLFGVCLGHQAIGQAFGARISLAKHIMHGKTSEVWHNGSGVFRNLPNPFTVTRYHSLVIAPDSLPDEFEMTAWTLDDKGEIEEIMGVRHKRLQIEGVQYHPESILSEHGHEQLAHFLRDASLLPDRPSD